MRDIRCLDRRAEGKTEAGVFVPVADMSGRNPVWTAVEIEKPAKPALDIVHRGAALRSFAQRQRLGPMLLADRQQSSCDVVEGFVPTDPLPPRIGVALGPGALERIIQAVRIVNQFGRGLAFDAHDAAIGMIVVRLQLCHPPVLDGGDGGAVGRAKGAVAAHFPYIAYGLCWFGHVVLRLRLACHRWRFKSSNVQQFKVRLRNIDPLMLERDFNLTPAGSVCRRSRVRSRLRGRPRRRRRGR